MRQEAFILLHNALDGCGGTAAATAYSEAYRLITRFSTLDKSFVVRIAAARCLKAFSNIGGPGLGTSEFDTLASYCLKVSLMCQGLYIFNSVFFHFLGRLMFSSEYIIASFNVGH